ncbi:MAG: methylmalonyl Co-A mutase-associated GTPase MeaB [Saprospiraceae bacterium]
MRHPLPSVEQFVQGIRRSDRVLLGQAITLVESTREDHQAIARQIIAQLLLAAGTGPPTTLRIAVTGAPGVGKSTFIEALGLHLIAQGKRPAVLAIDPSSTLSGGSILGDKTRMEQLSTSGQAFIRPSPSGDSLGGVARKTREAIILVEAAGFDTIIIETVGVGQSEIAAQRMTDVFLLLLLPGAGDELQGIKRGIVEMADFLIVNKSDGDRVKLANQAQGHYLNAIHLFPPKSNNWQSSVMACSALENKGISEVWELILEFQRITLANGFLQKNRRHQAQFWLEDALEEGLKAIFYKHPAVKEKLAEVENEVLAGRISPTEAAAQVIEKFIKQL